MDSQPQENWLPPADDPDALLDAAKAHPEWTDRQRAACLDRLILKFAPSDLATTARRRFADLGGSDGELILRIAEALATDDLLRDLAHALMEQPDLSAERVWDALTLFQGSSVLDEFPELAELCAELEAIAEDSGEVVEELAQQIESDPEGPWLALRGLDAIEPEIRVEIISELAQRSSGPGIVDFLRLLTFAEDPATRLAALDALEQLPSDREGVAAAWRRILKEHHDPEMLEAAKQGLGPDAWLSEGLEPEQGQKQDQEKEQEQEENDLPAPLAQDAGLSRIENSALVSFAAATPPDFEPLDALITSLDSDGRGYIALKANHRGKRVVAAFECDVWRGVVQILGETEETQANALFASFLTQTEYDVIVGSDIRDLASDLLAGSMSLSGTRTPGDWRFWTERSLGPRFRPGPFSRGIVESWLDDRLLAPSIKQAEALLDSCPAWLDRSHLIYELAEEISLRENGDPPDPHRDSSIYRYLFERELHDRLNWSRQKLIWMAWFWEMAGDREFAKSAFGIASQLADPQHAIPQHPFVLALTTRSLEAAQAHLAAGIDLRNPRSREQWDWDRWRPFVSSATAKAVAASDIGTVTRGRGKARAQNAV